MKMAKLIVACSVFTAIGISVGPAADLFDSLGSRKHASAAVRADGEPSTTATATTDNNSWD
ncbi:hypothetical protein ACWGB8_21105 [Kitasatospora sp. NPDC054939]